MAKKKVQTNLFGEVDEVIAERRDEVLPPLCIVKPKKSSYEVWVKHLTYHESVDMLRLMSAPFVDLLRKYRMYYCDKNSTEVVPPCFAKMLATGNKPKGVLAEFLAFFLEPSNFMLYFNSLSPKLQELWRTTFLKGHLTAKEAQKIVGEEVMGQVSRWYKNEGSLRSYLQGWFEVGYAYSGRTLYASASYEGTISLNRAVTKHLMRAIFADVMSKEVQLDSLPKDKQLLTFCGEDRIFTELPTIIALRDSNVLTQNQNGRMAQNGLKAAAKKMNMPEFFPAGCEANVAMLRSQMVLNVVGNAVPTDHRKKQPKEEELVKDAIEKATVDDAFLLGVLLTEMTGLRATLFYNSDVVEVADAFFDTVCHTDCKKWRTFDALLLETMVTSCTLNYQLFHSYDYERVNVHNKYNSKDVCFAQVREQIMLPMLRGYAFLLAALGLVEIAYRQPKRGDVSPYDGLQYIRVTELGRYCAEKIKSYTPKSIAGKQFFEADEQQLIIKSLEAENPLLPVVTVMADPITQRLYKVSYASFLRDCSTSKDIDNRIAQFKRYVCATPSAVWRQFFADVRRRFKPFTTVSTKYSLAQIPADNKELQRILLTDPVIRKYTIKAEGYLLLIEIAHQKQVAERLKTYGYLI